MKAVCHILYRATKNRATKNVLMFRIYQPLLSVSSMTMVSKFRTKIVVEMPKLGRLADASLRDCIGVPTIEAANRY
jgi:hypothetical protein